MSSSKEIKCLTGLRGVAALWVVLFHYFGQFWISAVLIRSSLTHGYIAVDLFFVLSGFVMAFTYARAFETDPNLRTHGSFLLRRFGRIYPLYLFCTVSTIGLILCRAIPRAHLTPLDLASNLVAVQAWHMADSIDGPGWSISTEFAAYLAFPILILHVVKPNAKLRHLLAVVLAGSLLLVFVAAQPDAALREPPRIGPLHAYRGDTIYPLLRCVAGFVIGLCAFRIFRMSAARAFLASGRCTDAVALLALMACAFHRADFVIVPLFALMIVCLSFEKGLAARILASPVLYWLGLISYSLYLVHVPLLFALGPDWTHILQTSHLPHAAVIANIALVVLSLLVAQITYRLIELPARQWFRRQTPKARGGAPSKPQGAELLTRTAAAP